MARKTQTEVYEEKAQELNDLRKEKIKELKAQRRLIDRELRKLGHKKKSKKSKK